VESATISTIRPIESHNGDDATKDQQQKPVKICNRLALCFYRDLKMVLPYNIGQTSELFKECHPVVLFIV
jgi:hypothetical protein